jgi:hypothetical protein
LYAKSRIVLGTPLTEEGDGFSAVEETMVVCERDDHDGTGFSLMVCMPSTAAWGRLMLGS